MKIFNKRLEISDKNEGRLEKLKKVEEIDKNQLEKQLKPIENNINNASTTAFKKLRFLIKQSNIAKKKLNREIDYAKLVCVHRNGKMFDFDIFRRVGDFIGRIYFGDTSLKRSIDK